MLSTVFAHRARDGGDQGPAPVQYGSICGVIQQVFSRGSSSLKLLKRLQRGTRVVGSSLTEQRLLQLLWLSKREGR